MISDVFLFSTNYREKKREFGDNTIGKGSDGAMSPFCKGMTAGLIVGTTLAVALVPKSEKKCKCIKHNTGKILKGAGSVIESLQSIL